MSTTEQHGNALHETTHKPISNRDSLYILIPPIAARTLPINPGDQLHVTLTVDGDRLTWYQPRTARRIGDSLYCNIPSDALDILTVTADTDINIHTYPDRIEYRAANADHGLVIRQSPRDGESPAATASYRRP